VSESSGPARAGDLPRSPISGLAALPQFEIAAVCTRARNPPRRRPRHYGVSLAFSDPDKLAQHPDVDLVTVSVKVPDHYRPVMAAIEPGKHVYCEWPLAATRRGGADARCGRAPGCPACVGLQGQMSPAINYARTWSPRAMSDGC